MGPKQKGTTVFELRLKPDPHLPDRCGACGTVTADLYRVCPLTGWMLRGSALCVPCYEDACRAESRDAAHEYAARLKLLGAALRRVA